MALAGIDSSQTFRNIREAARVKGPSRGEHGYCYTMAELHALIRAAKGKTGTRIWEVAAQKWEDYAMDSHP